MVPPADWVIDPVLSSTKTSSSPVTAREICELAVTVMLLTPTTPMNVVGTVAVADSVKTVFVLFAVTEGEFVDNEAPI